MKSKLLYVEDDQVQVSLVKPILEDEGYSVFHVSNGFAALDVLAESRFEAVLSDYYMPNMNGIELLEEIKARQYGIPVVMMTAANDVSLAFSALRAGAADFIGKDADANYLDLIGPVLGRTIRQHALQLEAAALAAQLESEKQISYQTLDALTQGVLVLDESRRIKYCNRFLRTLFRVGDEEPLINGDLRLVSSIFASRRSHDQSLGPREIQERLSACLDGADTPLELKVESRTFLLQNSRLAGTGYAITLTDITHERAQLTALDTIITEAPVAMMVVDAAGRIVVANQKAYELTGAAASSLLGTHISRFVPAQQRPDHDGLIRGYFNNPTSRKMRSGLELPLFNAHGKAVPVEIALSLVETQGERRVLATIVDISRRKEAETALMQAHQLTQSIIDNAPFGIIATDVDGMIVAVSPALEKMIGYDRDELIRKGNTTLFLPATELETWAAQLSEELGTPLDANFFALVAKAQRGVVEGREWDFVRKDGSRLPVNLTVTTLRNTSGGITGYLLVAYDITEQKRAQAYIEHAATHDGLTGLPNRNLMQDRLERSLLRMKRFNRKIAVIVMDLDHFKRINDTLGHLAGDQLLKTVAERLSQLVRESDTVCRMGGDEFVMVLPDMETIPNAQEVCKKILAIMSQPVSIGTHTLNVSPSIGLSIAPDHGTTVEDLLKHADIAMYQAKQAGRNGFQLFSPELAKTNAAELSIEQALQEAMRNNRIELHYLPQIAIDTGAVHGFEAMLHWHDPVLGLVPPEKFISLTETTGSIVALGEWALNQACMDLAAIRQAHGQESYVAVNVSPRQFEHSGFVETVQKALARAKLPPSSLALEITEELLVKRMEATLHKLVLLHQLGVKLVVNDFGTGNSMLAHLANFPIDIIKVDRKFLAVENPANNAILGAIAAIAKGLQLQVVAEGVETRNQLELVRAHNCRLVQGELFSAALPMNLIGDFLAGWPKATKKYLQR